jgi:hypothetical protein
MSDPLFSPQITLHPEEVARERHFGDALALCAKVGGFALDKQLASDLGVDRGQFSRWGSGTEGILWPKLEKIMEVCGNDAPVLWMVHQRGYDLHSLRRRESVVERENRHLREENAALRRVLQGDRDSLLALRPAAPTPHEPSPQRRTRR